MEQVVTQDEAQERSIRKTIFDYNLPIDPIKSLLRIIDGLRNRAESFEEEAKCLRSVLSEYGSDREHSCYVQMIQANMIRDERKS